MLVEKTVMVELGESRPWSLKTPDFKYFNPIKTSNDFIAEDGR